MKLRRLLAAALAVAPVAALPGGDRPAAAAPAGGYRIVLTSNRDGRARGYSARPDGSRLTPLLAPGRRLVPVAVSADGSTIAYTAPDPILARNFAVYVSRGSGARLRRVASGLDPALSPDGKLLAFEGSDGITVVGTDGRGRRTVARGGGAVPSWSPDGRSLVFGVQIHQEPDRYAVVLQPLHGRRRVLVRTGPGEAECLAEALQPAWSPDGKWIAYLDCEDDPDRAGLWIFRPDGTHRRHLTAGGDTFAWSPDSRRLAVNALGRVYVVRATGGYRSLDLHTLSARSLAWSPDGRMLVLSAAAGDEDRQIWLVGADGRGLRRVTGSGANDFVGWTRLAPARRPAPPLPRTERVVSATSVSVRTRVTSLSADGPRVAFVATRTKTDCDHVSVWAPAARSLHRFRLPSPCRDSRFDTTGVYDVRLAGSRAVWVSFSGGSGECDFNLDSATLVNPLPLSLTLDSFGDCASPHYDPHARGDGGLLVFDDESRLVRIGVGREQCEKSAGLPSRICSTLRTGAHAYPVESVSGGLIAIREPDAVAVLDAHGGLVRVFPFSVGAARLDGGSLVVVRSAALEVYDVASGTMKVSRPLPDGYALTDADGGIAVLLRDRTIVLLRLDNGRSLTLTPGAGPVLADLEPPGLYYSFATGDGGGRVVFLPRPSLLRQLR